MPFEASTRLSACLRNVLSTTSTRATASSADLPRVSKLLTEGFARRARAAAIFSEVSENSPKDWRIFSRPR